MTITCGWFVVLGLVAWASYTWGHSVGWEKGRVTRLQEWAAWAEANPAVDRRIDEWLRVRHRGRAKFRYVEEDGDDGD